MNKTTDSLDKNVFPERPIPDCYWVQPNLLAGEYPGAYEDGRARLKVRRLLQAGITFFLDLTQAGELQPYATLLPQEARATSREVEHRRMPIRDLSTPTPEMMSDVLDTIDAALAAGHTLYVHCWGGIGRTGTVVGCYLVRHGRSGDEALAEIARLRRGIPDETRVSPETETQRRMVLTWAKVSAGLTRP